MINPDTTDTTASRHLPMFAWMRRYAGACILDESVFADCLDAIDWRWVASDSPALEPPEDLIHRRSQGDLGRWEVVYVVTDSDLSAAADYATIRAVAGWHGLLFDYRPHPVDASRTQATLSRRTSLVREYDTTAGVPMDPTDSQTKTSSNGV